MSAEARLKELNLELPAAGRALGVYKPIVVVRGLAYLSGHGPVGADGTATCGRLGEDLTREAGYDAARRTALAVLSTLRQHCGSLDRVRRLVKTTGFVQSTADFREHPAVINGFSELIRDVFGADAGIGARSALGVPSLPAGWAVEIETIFELDGE
ncbi:MAG TPA: RidA family protein [Lacipirellulaceae bacterium]|jgi:enamine deaminase RidA (YjgF/YER057c/UK114 family)